MEQRNAALFRPPASLMFRLGGWDALKGPGGEMKVTQEQREQTVFLLGDTALLFLACHTVLMFVVENMWAREEMMCERHGRKLASWAVTITAPGE